MKVYKVRDEIHFMDRVVNCIKCIHFNVTWDKKFPRGCKLYGFKTSRMPSELVFQSTGERCPNFKEKASSSVTDQDI